MNESLKEKLLHYQQRVETAIDHWIPRADTRPVKLHEAMRYSMEAGGKRIRPVLVIAASELFPSQANPDAAAVAIECLHTYTLIHDDLPSIDDSDLRRGRPSCHAQFDEATAVLAGDALLTYSFQLLTRAYREDPILASDLVSDLSEASGSERLIGGQMEDVDNEGKPIDAAMLQFIHENKTGALLTAALTMGLRFCKPTRAQIETITEVGYHMGMTFQIVDDILDATSTAEVMGKPVGNDHAAEKSTYVALHGIEGAYAEATRHNQAAISAAEALGGNNNFLIDLIRELGSRVS
ncbi:MAG TPA: polyprenyl synthetase [Opitutae bacterium]|nr:polyprenyl synthetase [Opitutae bacterium]